MRALYSLVAAVALVLLSGLPVSADLPATVQGQLVNGSKGGSPVPGLEVTLRPSSPEGGPDQQATTGPDGNFVFSLLTATAPVSYTLSASYAGVLYRSPVLDFGPGERLKGVNLPVYDTTEDGSSIQADLAHVVIEIDPGAQTLVVSQYQAFSNRGDRTYSGRKSTSSEKRLSLLFPLPQGAVHVQPINGLVVDDLVSLPQGQGFADTAPFQPGKREVAYSYMLDYAEPTYTFFQPVAYPTSRINFLIADTGAQVRVPGLSVQRTVDIEGKKFLLLSGEGLSAGQSVEVQLSGLPLGQGAAKGTADNLKLAAVALPVVALGLALGFFLKRSSRPQMQPAPITMAIDDEKARLVQALAELDDSYEAGRIAEPEYQRLRAQKKQRLAELW